MASSNVKFETVQTPNPNEVMIRVWQDANQMVLNTLPTLGMPYTQTGLPVSPRMTDFKDYVYADMEKEGDRIWFYFAKPKTTAQANTPFRTSYSTRQYPWPGVLYSLNLFQTTEFPQTVNNGISTVTAPRYFAKYYFKPTPNISSVIKIEEYLSNVPFPQAVLTHNQPIPTDISGNFLGLDINFPRCLHPRVIFQTNVPGATQVFGQGTVDVNTLITNPTLQTFPATNFLDWEPFIIDDDVKIVNGQYYRNRVTIFPPLPPENVIQ